MSEPISSKTHPLLFHVLSLRTPEGGEVNYIDANAIMAAIYDPHKHWLGAKAIVITRDGSTVEDCLKAIAPRCRDGAMPTPAEIEEAIAFAAS